MNNIEIEGHFGNEVKKVRLTQPNGTGAGLYHVIIGGYYHGQIINQQGVWRAYLNDKSELTYDDTRILIDLIENHE